MGVKVGLGIGVEVWVGKGVIVGEGVIVGCIGLAVSVPESVVPIRGAGDGFTEALHPVIASRLIIVIRRSRRVNLSDFMVFTFRMQG